LIGLSVSIIVIVTWGGLFIACFAVLSPVFILKLKQVSNYLNQKDIQHYKQVDSLVIDFFYKTK
jgi:hypothetical protein